MKASLLLILFFYSISAFADARGYIATELRAFTFQQPEPVERYEGRLLAEYDNKFSANEIFSLKVHPFFLVSSASKSWGEDFIADPRELYGAVEYENVYAHAGYFTLVYEGTDGLNPMDIASMKYWGDPLSPITKASAGLHFGYMGNMFEVEAAYIPEQSRSSLPGEESPWYPRSVRFPLSAENIELRLPTTQVEYIMLDKQVLDKAFKHNYTARAQLRTDYGDAAAAFFEGAADTPLIFPTLDVIPIQVSPTEIYQLQSPLRITPRYYRRRTVAGLVTVPLGEWIFRVASRYDEPLGSAKRFTTYSGQSVAGVERSFNISDDVVTFILQGSVVERPESTSLVSMQDLFDRSVLLGMRWPINDYWTTQLSGLRSGSDESAFYTAQVTRTFATQWSGRLLFEMVEGPPQSVLGIYDNNDRLSFELRRAF